MKKITILIFLLSLLFFFGVVLLLFSNLGDGNESQNVKDHTHEEFENIRLDHVREIAANPSEIPKKIERNFSTNITLKLETKEVVYTDDLGDEYLYWTFNNTVPGPMLRVREGDSINLILSNHNTSMFTHSIDLHAVNGPGGGSTKTQINPGETKNFTFEALNPGLYVYHCATPHVAHHVTNGMYGMILVEPEEGLDDVDKEFYVMQGELYWGDKKKQGVYTLDSKKVSTENPNQIIFNGRINALTDNPLKARVNESIRIYVGNSGIAKISSFHIIGEIFDRVYPEAATNLFYENVQTTLIPTGGASIVEFRISEQGEYILVDHALARVEKGAAGVIKVT